MQHEAVLIDIPVEYVRMLHSHRPDPPAPQIHFRYIEKCLDFRRELKNNRLHEYDSVILDHVDFRGGVIPEVVELGRILANLDRRVLFWSKFATTANVPVGCMFLPSYSRKAASQLIRWITGLSDNVGSVGMQTAFPLDRQTLFPSPGFEEMSCISA